MTAQTPPSPRTEVRRGSHRADYDPATIEAILEAGVIAHVGVATEEGPIVLPMAYGVRDSHILLHGSVANAMLRSGTGVDVCITVTIVDGLVVARTPLHNSMNYRSVVIRGSASRIEQPADKLAALKVINDHIADLWDTARPPGDVDVKQTMVLSVPLIEASAKVRAGDPIDEPDDVAGPFWAGVVPLTSRWGQPVPAENLRPDANVPPAVGSLADTDAHRRPVR